MVKAETGVSRHYVWLHSNWRHRADVVADAFMRDLWGHLQEGGRVAAFCLQSRHRSPASLVFFFMRWLGFSLEEAIQCVVEHPETRLQQYRSVEVLYQETASRNMVSQQEEHAEGAGAPAPVVEGAGAPAPVVDEGAGAPAPVVAASRGPSVPRRAASAPKSTWKKKHKSTQMLCWRVRILKDMGQLPPVTLLPYSPQSLRGHLQG